MQEPIDSLRAEGAGEGLGQAASCEGGELLVKLHDYLLGFLVLMSCARIVTCDY